MGPILRLKLNNNLHLVCDNWKSPFPCQYLPNIWYIGWEFSTDFIAFIQVHVIATTRVFQHFPSKTNIFLQSYPIDVVPTRTDFKDIYQSQWFECYQLHEIYAWLVSSKLLRGRMNMSDPSDWATWGILRMQAHILIPNGWNYLKLIHDQTHTELLNADILFVEYLIA